MPAASGVTFRRALQKWHLQNARQFPWRQRDDPYGIVVAELLLRKTTATQAANVYAAFVTAYPTWDALACAEVDDLKDLLRSLGILDRARLLRQLAIQVVNELGGRLPADAQLLLRLPGVGPYTANAVLAFAYGKDVALVDSNVIRVLGRVFGWRSQKQRPHQDHYLWARAQSLIPRSGSRAYHFALLDFAALVCKARAPQCPECPLAQDCQYQLSTAELKRQGAR